MLYKKIDLDERYPDANLTFYVHDDADKDLPMIVVCPGGGYGFVSAREAMPVALRFVGMGYCAFVLRYSTGHDAAGFARAACVHQQQKKRIREVNGCRP